MNDLQTRWSSRKFWTMLAATALATGLLLAGHITEDAYIWLFGMTIGSYFTANVAQYFSGRK